MTELEEAKLKIEYLKDEIIQLELRLSNAMTFVEMMVKQLEKEMINGEP